jgi:choline transport protein
MGKCSTVSPCSRNNLSPADFNRSAYFGLFNGGTAGVIWMMIITWIFVLAMIASLAEMASMAPTAGGQYHWVSEFAPPSFQKSLSYIVGM